MNRDVCEHFNPVDLPCDKCKSASVQKSTLREAAQQALEALEWFNKYGSEEHGPSLRGAECSLRAALAEPVQEPVAWSHNLIDNIITHRPADIDRHPDRWTPLYTVPPQRKPLTDEEIGKVAAPYYGAMGFRVEAFARAIERAHGIGEKE